MNNDWLKHALAITFFVVIAVIGIYDVFAGASYGKEATVSAITRGLARDYPIIYVLCGVVVGHLFWC
jgi:hypothetical protein